MSLAERLINQNDTVEPSRLVELPRAVDERSWPALRYFSLYRIVISGLFAVLALSDKLPPNFSTLDLRSFTLAAFGYVLLAVVGQVAVEKRWFAVRYQVYAQVIVDITAITVFIRASGGVGSGFGMLMVVAIAGACLFYSRGQRYLSLPLRL
jgi:two-component system sensor histidine kinase PilS (NtrC family)